MLPKGMFLSLDGLDGSGKSTQCRLLAEYLKSIGISVVSCQDPGSTEIGRDLRRIVLHHKGDLSRSCEANLFMAARAQMLTEIILPALDRGETVISDRYLLATMAYQGHGSGLDIPELRQATLFAAGAYFRIYLSFWTFPWPRREGGLVPIQTDWKAVPMNTMKECDRVS